MHKRCPTKQRPVTSVNVTFPVRSQLLNTRLLSKLSFETLGDIAEAAADLVFAVFIGQLLSAPFDGVFGLMTDIHKLLFHTPGSSSFMFNLFQQIFMELGL